MSSGKPTAIYLVSNPAAGARVTSELVGIVKRRLAERGIGVTDEFTTEAANDGVRIGSQLSIKLTANTDESQEPVTVVLFGGDGTTYEFLNGLYQDEQRAASLRQVQLIIVPTGTANALYAGLFPPETSHRYIVPPSAHDKAEEGHAWRLRSLEAFLSHRDTIAESLHDVTLARTRLTLADGTQKTILTHLVTSHALHAAILQDSEALRSEHPGVERFKLAAMKNLDKWVDGTLTLHGSYGDGRTSTVQQFHPEEQRFAPASDGPTIDVQGPIFYLVCASTDRLEPSFVPAPFAFPAKKHIASEADKHGSDRLQQLSRPADTLDIVVIRPLRDPAIRAILSNAGGSLARQNWEDNDTSKARKAFADLRAVPITRAMYSEGKHVFLRYPDADGNPTDDLSPDNRGVPVIEYYRCAGYTWKPVSYCELT